MTRLARDPWSKLSELTQARIALGRAGGSLRTQTQLDLRLSHARARDGIYREFDWASLAKALCQLGVTSLRVSTRATHRQEYLLSPERGRSLDGPSLQQLADLRACSEKRELVIVVSDGLSSLAADRHVTPLLGWLLPQLDSLGITYYPVLLAPFGRVKLGDEVGEVLAASLSLVLLGERPGLSSHDSLGAYVTYCPSATSTDADRNCVSNIRPDGLTPDVAGGQIRNLLLAARRAQISGVGLKHEGGATGHQLAPAPTLETQQLRE